MKTGKDLVRVAKQFLGGEYELGALPFKVNAEYLTKFRDGNEAFDPKKIKGKTDCAEFICTVLFGNIKALYGANNNKETDLKKVDAWTNFLKRDFDNGTLKEISINEAAYTAGAILLRYTTGSRIGHAAFCDGNGKATTEAHSKSRGITEALVNGRTWDVALLVPGIKYETTGKGTVQPPKGIVYRLKDKPFMKAEAVRLVAVELEKLGYNTNGTHTAKDGGTFGNGMYKAVIAYQKNKGLVVDGMFQWSNDGETVKSLGMKVK